MAEETSGPIAPSPGAPPPPPPAYTLGQILKTTGTVVALLAAIGSIGGVAYSQIAEEQAQDAKIERRLRDLEIAVGLIGAHLNIPGFPDLGGP